MVQLLAALVHVLVVLHLLAASAPLLVALDPPLHALHLLVAHVPPLALYVLILDAAAGIVHKFVGILVIHLHGDLVSPLPIIFP